MRTYRILPIIVALAVAVAPFANVQGAGPDAAHHMDFDTTQRFIFYSVLEGLYEDGLATADVEQILMKKPEQNYFHFIYSCPICQTTIWALEAYRARPQSFYGLKSDASTFGPGLSQAMHTRLYSGDPRERLGAINELMRGWMDRRMKQLRLTKPERAELVEELENKRKKGMEALESFRKHQHGPTFGVAEAAPAYVELEECAVCNAAVGKPMKLPEAKPK